MGEIGRRLVHASGVVIPTIYLVGLVTWEQFGYLLIFGSAVAVVLEVLRLYFGLQEWWLYARLTREYEANSVAGYALYMFSITVVGLIFEPSIAIPGMLMLMLGDPVSGYLSSGGLRPIKGIVPLTAMFVVCLVIAAPFAIPTVGSVGWGVFAAALAAILATVADGVKLTLGGYILDDNLTIPPAAAIGLWVAYTLLPL